MPSGPSFNRDNCLHSAIDTYMIQLGKCYRTTNKVTEDLLTTLHELFPLHAVAALDLVDCRSVTLMTSPSGRRIYSCVGSSDTPYLIPYTAYMCTCPAYRRNTGPINTFCKHLVATQLSIAMDVVQFRDVTEDAMMSMLTDLLSIDA